jgi:hypothetical protein
MAKNLIQNDISELLEMIQYQYSIISRYEEKIPQIEMDIIMGNIRRLYEDFFELNKLNQRYKADTNQPDNKEMPKGKEEPVKTQKIEKPLEKTIEEIPASKEQLSQKDVFPEPMQEKEEAFQPKKEIRETTKLKDTGKSHQKKGTTADLFAEMENNSIAEKFKDSKKSLHDVITSEKKEKTLADTIHTPIADLRSGIGVNDRFLFINDLFKGSQQDYTSAIEEINGQGSFDDAILIINLMKEQYHWAETSEGLTRLISFVKRRFR